MEIKIEYDTPIPQSKRGKWDFLKALPYGTAIAVPTEKDAYKVRDAFRSQGDKCVMRKMNDAYRVWKIDGSQSDTK